MALKLKKSSSDFYEDELRDLLTYDCPITGERRCPPYKRVKYLEGNWKTFFKVVLNEICFTVALNMKCSTKNVSYSSWKTVLNINRPF